jgi:hypothetical protein
MAHGLASLPVVVSVRWVFVSPFANVLTDADRFWSKVDRSGDCWFWMGARDAHGYGRVVIDQEQVKAHRLAWFMVMGTWPAHGLYHVGSGGPYSRTNPGAERVRGCVRPHHFRDGPTESAPTRWAKRAQSGFPPEFRSVATELMPTEQAQTDLMPLLLYRGNLTVGRAQALFNFTMAAQAAEADRLGDVVAMSRAWPDVTHAVGLHKPITATSSVGRFWDRLVAHPEVTDTRPGMREYIRGVMADSGWRSLRLDPIDRYSPWSTRRWRSGRRSMAEIHAAADARARLTDEQREQRRHERGLRRVERERQRAVNATPMPEVWPFIPTAPASEHDLVMAVDEVVPKTLPEWLRQDICQDLILLVLEGDTTVDNLRDATPEAVRAVFRMYPGKYGPLSLDKGDSETDLTLLDTLAAAPLILGGESMTLADLRDRLAAEEAVA